jgi:hypothetical protein
MGFFGGGGSSVDLASPSAIGSTTPNTGKFTTLTLAPSANTTPFTASGYSLTGANAQSFFDLSGTWNTTGTPTAFKLNVTNTASNASSRLFDLQSGGTSRFFVQAVTGVVFSLEQYVAYMDASYWGQEAMQLVASGEYRWSSGFGRNSVADVILARDAAGVLAQRRTTNAQTFRLYNTFTDASNYERGIFSWSSNVLEIGSECAGTGATRTTRLVAQDKAGGFVPTIELAFKPNNTLSKRLSFTNNSGAFIQWGVDGTFFGHFTGEGFSCGTRAMGFSQSSVNGLDAYLIRDAANIIAQRNSTNAQTFRLYNTFTSDTNFERLNFRWASNEFILDAEKGSAGGTLRGIKIGSATSSLLGFYGVTPVDQPATVADPAGGGTIDTEARTAINAIIDRLQELGLIA